MRLHVVQCWACGQIDHTGFDIVHPTIACSISNVELSMIVVCLQKCLQFVYGACMS